uniref:Uncharacterized protein n=1 Tax=Angiostrongylus cantonensis TaxID=6313 RepID=A0A0K0D262_ANGCA
MATNVLLRGTERYDTVQSCSANREELMDYGQPTSPRRHKHHVIRRRLKSIRDAAATPVCPHDGRPAQLSRGHNMLPRRCGSRLIGCEQHLTSHEQYS